MAVVGAESSSPALSPATLQPRAPSPASPMSSRSRPTERSRLPSSTLAPTPVVCSDVPPLAMGRRDLSRPRDYEYYSLRLRGLTVVVVVDGGGDERVPLATSLVVPPRVPDMRCCRANLPVTVRNYRESGALKWPGSRTALFNYYYYALIPGTYGVKRTSSILNDENFSLDILLITIAPYKSITFLWFHSVPDLFESLVINHPTRCCSEHVAPDRQRRRQARYLDGG